MLPSAAVGTLPPQEVPVPRPSATLAALAMLTAAPALAAAQAAPPNDTQSIRVGATIFYDYTFTNQPETVDADGNVIKPSAFDVKRAYISISGTVSHVVSFRITPDIRRETGGGSSLNGSLNFRLKYAYAQFNLADWLSAGSRVRVGVHQTPYIESQEGVYRYRFQGTVFAEREGGLSSADAGVSFRTLLPDDYGDVQVGLYNGEGYTRPEANNQPSLQVRATVRPLPETGTLFRGLRATAFYFHDHYVQDAERRRFIAAALYEHDRFNAGFDLLTGTDRTSVATPAVDSRGVSVFVTPFFDEKGRGLEGLLRVDRFTPDTSLDGVRTRLIVGGAYWFPHPGGAATAALLVDYEQVTFSRFATPQPKQQRLAVHGLINF
jgi:hypothetical protein